MRIRVKIEGSSQYGDWKPGDTGLVDGYVQGGDGTPYAVVVLDRTNESSFRGFVLVPIQCLRAM